MDNNNLENEQYEKKPQTNSTYKENFNRVNINRNNGFNNTGRTMKAGGTAMQGGGKAAQLAGKGGQALGKGLTSAGEALNSTKYGALLGVPLSALGKTSQAIGKATEKAGQAAEKTGKNIKETGQKIKEKGKNIKQKGKDKDPLNTKKGKKVLIICLIAVISLIIIFMFLAMMIVVLDIKIDKSSSSGGSYSEVTMNTNGTSNEELWWPIGSKEVTTTIEVDEGNIEFRSGTPVSTVITAGFSDPDYPNHGANDISAGGDIYLIAMGDGVVTDIYCGSESNPCSLDGGYNVAPDSSYSCPDPREGGIGIIITYNNGYISKYFHLENSSIPSYLNIGDKVYQGQVVGKMGNTGCSTGQHLHLALTVNGSLVDPSNYVSEENPRPMSEGVTTKSEDALKNSISSSSSSNAGTGEFVSGSNTTETVCKTFKSYGYPDTGISALMINMHYESTFNETSVNELGCVGLVQWCFGRMENLKLAYGDDWVKVSNQLERVYNELNSSYYSDVNDSLKGNGSVSDKLYYFCMHYEIPGESSCNGRLNDNRNIIQDYTDYVANGCQGEINESR